MTENCKKEFDPTVSFMFFSDWLEAIEDAETEIDRESEAYMLFKAIANYSLFNEEPDFEGYPATRAFKRFWPILSRQIDASIKNRKRGFKDTNGPTEKGKKVIEAVKENPQASIRKIADITGVSKSEVGRVKRRYLPDDTIPAPIPDANINADAIPNANAGTGHGTGRDTGQTGIPVHSGEFRTDLAPIDFILAEEANNSPETKPGGAVGWYKKWLERWDAITPFGGAESRIITHYLSTHKETPLEKKFGDRYGRYITGWDPEKAEPIISYCFGFVPLELLKHNTADIPEEYVYGDWTRSIDKFVFGDKLIIPGVPDDGVVDDDYIDDLPW